MASQHPWREYVNPLVGTLLGALKLDKRYVQGKGCLLFDERNRQYLDFLANYGTCPLGYNPSEVWNAVLAVREREEPIFVLPSLLEGAGDLAKRLIEIAPHPSPSEHNPLPLRYVCFANSGSEAVEFAFKIARAHTHRKGILSTIGGFHGGTLGALSATGRPKYQTQFGVPVEGFDLVPFGDIAALEAKFKERDAETDESKKIAAFIVEPVQGEGGVIVAPPGYLRAACALCHRYGALFILDEVQTGLGRTGTLFACQNKKVLGDTGETNAGDLVPDLLVVAKALGGGVVPIGAVLIGEHCFPDFFAYRHSSTFAGNALACRAAIATLDVITRNNYALLSHVQSLGKRLYESLESLVRCEFPRFLNSVRGVGLLLGVQFANKMQAFWNSPATGSFLLGVMAEQLLLAAVVSSHLLNVEGIRVATTLNRASVLRIEPPLVATAEMAEQLIGTLRRTLQSMADHGVAGVLAHLVGRSLSLEGRTRVFSRDLLTESVAQTNMLKKSVSHSVEGPLQWGFIINPPEGSAYANIDPSLAVFTPSELEDLAGRLGDLLEPFVLAKMAVVFEQSPLHNTRGVVVVVPRTNKELSTMPRERAIGEVVAGIAAAMANGVTTIGMTDSFARVLGAKKPECVATLGAAGIGCEGFSICTSGEESVFPAEWFVRGYFPQPT